MASSLQRGGAVFERRRHESFVWHLAAAGPAEQNGKASALLTSGRAKQQQQQQQPQQLERQRASWPAPQWLLAACQAVEQQQQQTLNHNLGRRGVLASAAMLAVCGTQYGRPGARRMGVYNSILYLVVCNCCAQQLPSADICKPGSLTHDWFDVAGCGALLCGQEVLCLVTDGLMSSRDLFVMWGVHPHLEPQASRLALFR
ncbi:hypothetical protein COO60DRAFT_1206314 [Scenedesmus sp. NREL 46B-D3]|nr:hypothetical protein COO60DRAFT_1206314 [Scenedesmus sp. NREL 46B-D3]